MRIGRTLPPAATSIGFSEIVSGILGILNGEKELERFRSELKQQFGVRHCFVVSSGKAAFTLILLALKELYPDRDEVLIPGYTCYSVPSSIVRADLRIRLCDQSPDGLDFDLGQMSAMLTGGLSKKVLSVVPTHLFGFPADVTALRKMIQDQDVTIIEDAAQAMGETSKGRKLGTLGDVGFFSLGRGKAFSVVEGGVILTDRDDIADILNRLISPLPGYGLLQLLKLVFKAAALMMLIHPRLFWLPRSLPFLKLGETLFEPDFPMLKMSAFQAGLARNWQVKLELLRAVRNKKVNQLVANIESRRTLEFDFSSSSSLGLSRFPIRVRDKDKREALLRESARKGMGIMPAYPTSINAIPELKGKVGTDAFPVAESCAREFVTLPTHAYLTDDDVEEIGGLVSHSLG